MEAVKEGRLIIVRVPLEGGGRLVVSVNDDEAKELFGEVDELIARWAERTRGREPGRRTYLMMSVVQPYPDAAE